MLASVIDVWQDRVSQRRQRVGALVRTFCCRLVRLRDRNLQRMCQKRVQEEERKKQGVRIAGTLSKAKLRRGLTERELAKQQRAAAAIFSKRI